MKIQAQWIDEWKNNLEPKIAQFLTKTELITGEEEIRSKRFLTRSIIPHIKKLQEVFNRSGDTSIDQNYWKKISSSDHFRTAYFLGYMPANLVRVAAVLGELRRWGFKFQHSSLRILELGAGPASAAAAWCEVSRLEQDWLPPSEIIALIEKDRKTLELGAEWIRYLTRDQNILPSVQTFHRTIDWSRDLLPKTAPEFDVILSSFFINEAQSTPEEIAEKLFFLLKNHLARDGLWIGVEPALKIESRKLLAIRKHLIARIERSSTKLKVLLPCLGHQACGALEKEGDWCHEEVIWWRPQYLKLIDEMAEIDRRSLPFSYLVVANSDRDLLSLLPQTQHESLSRLVSPTHDEGTSQEFHICDQSGKRKVRWKTNQELERGDIISIESERGDPGSRRIDQATKI